MKQRGILFIGCFVITLTAAGQNTGKLDSLQRVITGLEQEIKVIDRKVSEVKNEINRISGTNPGTIVSASSTNDRYTELVKKYGQSDAALIQNKGYRIGMTKEMLIESLGAPEKQSAYKSGDSINERLHYKTKGMIIQFAFDDGILESFYEL